MNALEEFINSAVIPALAPGMIYVFRGESRAHNGANGRMSSGLYRSYCLQKGIAEGDYLLAAREIVKKAGQHFPHGTSNIEILTELQHFGGETALIDFTYNLHIAVFFGCCRYPEQDGHLYPFPMTAFSEKADIKYDGSERDADILIKPAGKGPRPIVQHSVFVHAHRGYLDIGQRITIEAAMKKKLLKDLAQYYNIKRDTIYNDIYGFIREQGETEQGETEYFIQGLIGWKNGNHKMAEKCFTEAIELNPHNTRADDYCSAIRAGIGYETAIARDKMDKTAP